MSRSVVDALSYRLYKMKTKVLVFLVFYACSVRGMIFTTKPDFIETCYIKKPEFEQCSTKAVQNMFKHISKGLPEIGLQALEPMLIERIKVLSGEGPVSVNASLSEVVAKGFGNTIVLSNRVDPKTYDFYTKIKLNQLRIDGLYTLLGRILVIPLRGHGHCWFEAKDLDIFIKSDVKMEKHDGFNFFNITDLHVKFSIGGLKLHMGNLFDGIKALEDTTNAYLNANWRPVAESLNPILSKTIADIMLDIMKKLFDNIPADFLIGDIDVEP